MEFAEKLVGILKIEEKSFKENAVIQWTKELLDSCKHPQNSPTSFLSVLKKRVEVQLRLHKSYLRESERSRRKVWLFLNNNDDRPQLQGWKPRRCWAVCQWWCD